MTHLQTRKEGDEGISNVEFCTRSDETRRNRRLQSFVDCYGVEKPSLSTFEQTKRYTKKKCSSVTFECCINILLKRIPLFRCLKTYNLRKDLFGDIIAGITVAIMHIPQGMAYGTLTTLPPVYGLYVSFFPVIIYMIFGTSPHLSLGTFAIISLMTAQAIDSVSFEPSNIVTQNGTIANLTGSSSVDIKLHAATTLALLVGLIQLSLSFLRLGFLTVYLTEPFISGFTTGAATHVFTSQIPSAFGIRSPRGINGAFKLPRIYVKLIQSIFSHINWISTAIAAVSIVTLYIAKYLNDRYKSKIRIVLPLELVLIVIGTTVSHFLQLHSKYAVAVVGQIKRGLPAPSLPSFDHTDKLLVPAITIAAVSLSISISMAKMLSRKHTYKVSSNQELLAYGMANTVSSFFQCYPSAGSLSRSAVQEGSGGRTLLVGGFSSLVLGCVLVALTPLFQSLPMACLAAIIIVNLKGLFLQLKDFMLYFRISKLECILWTITFVTVVLFDVDIGLYVGLSTSFFINTVRTQRPRFFVLGQVDNTGIYKSTTNFPSVQQYPGIKILRFDESLYACNAPFFKRKFYELIGMETTEEPIVSCRRPETFDTKTDVLLKYIILECSPFNYIDTVGAKLLIQIFNDLKKRGIQLYLTECRYEVRHTLDIMKFYEKTELHTIYVTTHDAVMTAVAALNQIPTTNN
ncbi:unnamed protein product [Adineta ricciae]|uniref:STAS domain-containing protein n=1 Tax=Adineta ricciae TaxID=249248 RepID=A0A813Z051_ADIRI|nr:unnamed protein product [Adineta ricciae]CAF1622265.1 unnamed protein product [Adineta ricciae]